MRVFPRIGRPRIGFQARSLRRMSRRLRPEHALIVLEILILASAIVFVFTGSRAAYLNRFGPRADMMALAVLLLAFAALHLIVQRSVAPVIVRRYSPKAYDERRILLDLGDAARRAANVNQLYRLIIKMISGALGIESVSIFVRNEATGDFVCRITSQEEVTTADAKRPMFNSLLPTSEERLILTGDAFVVKRLRHLAIPLKIEQHDMETWMRALSGEPKSVQDARRRECATLEAMESSLLLQIRMKDQLVGILSIGRRNARHEFSVRDKEMLMSVAGQLALVIENSKLAERMVEEERTQRELAMASEVQQHLFPLRPPASRSLEMAYFCQPARTVGGDYYDFLVFEDEQIGIAVADVAGKGISAALLMSTVQATLRSQAMMGQASVATKGSLAQLVSSVNRLLCRSTGASSYATFFYAQYEESTKRLTYVNAGHNPPLLIRPANRDELIPLLLPSPFEADTSALKKRRPGLPILVESIEEQVLAPEAEFNCTQLKTGGMVIGLFEDCSYEEDTVQLQSGDLLITYTDGLTEALNRHGEEFGEERLCRLLISMKSLSATEIRTKLIEHIQQWCMDTAQHDDLTFVLLKVK
ncbi:MAG TPA: PP2C family protein-serine/threonine phosphatase [Pyrinomonadaceae bacterium]|nr:PP2C family protein-serine/threonine phosphatase [Pyrinomonadaceae bacterium]